MKPGGLFPPIIRCRLLMWGGGLVRSFADLTAAGDFTIVAAQGAGLKIRVVSLWVRQAQVFQSGMTWKSGSTAITAAMQYKGSVVDETVLPFNAAGWFETAANQALVLNLSVAGAVGVNVMWHQVTM